MSALAAGMLAFGFVSPWLLVGGLLLSTAPVLIHLLRRRQYVDRPWAAMQFLQSALRSQTRRVRLEALALLVVRTALIGLAGAALAQPYFDEDETRRELPSGRERVLVVDTSLSMNAGPRGAAPLDRARAAAAKIVDGSAAGDTFRLIQIRGIPPLIVIQQPSADRRAILQQINGLKSTQERADVAGALRAVRFCLEHAPPAARPEVVVISDFQSSNWLPDQKPAQRELSDLFDSIARSAELLCLHVKSERHSNLSLTDLRPVLGPPPARSVVAVEISVANSGAVPVADIPVEVFAGQQRVGLANVSIAPGDTVGAQIALSGLSPAERALVAQLPDDALADDNRRWLALPEPRPVEVLLVSGRPAGDGRRGAADYVQLALSPGRTPAHSGFSTTSVDAAGLAAADLARYACVFLCNPREIEAVDTTRLRAYVAAGGGLVVALGDQWRPAASPPGGDQKVEGLLPGSAVEIVARDEPVRFSPGDYRHPIIQPFAGNPDAGLLTTEIDRYWRVDLPEASSGDVVLAFSTGDPAIVEHRIGQGHVLLVTTSLDDAWSKWPLWPSFLPVVHELTRAAAAGADASLARLVGETLSFSLPADDFGVSVELRRPIGNVSELRKGALPDGTWAVTAIAESAGLHTLTFGSPRHSATTIAVNIDPAEGRLAFLDAPALAELATGAAIRSLENWQPAATPLLRTSHRGRLSNTLLLIVVGLLIVDQLMTWRFRAGLAALGLLLVAAPAATLGGRTGFLTALLAAALLAALALTLVVRSRLRIRPFARHSSEHTAPRASQWSVKQNTEQ